MGRGIGTTFITGPRVIKQVTGEDVDPQVLGGADTHASVTGIASITFESEEEAFETLRRLLRYLPPNNLDDPPTYEPVEPSRALEGIIPDDARRAYDVRELLRAVVDGGSLFEIQPR
jgi:acetyl-CoA carboxylase carboxyltransferase component